MKMKIEEHNIKAFKEFCKVNGEEIKDEQDLEDQLNKFIEQSLDLIY